MKKSDKIYIMQTALLECAIFHKIDVADLYFFESKKKKGTYYLVDKKSYLDKAQKTKVYLKKEF